MPFDIFNSRDISFRNIVVSSLSRPLTGEELQRRRDAARQRHAAKMEQREAAESAPPTGETVTTEASLTGWIKYL